MSSLHGPLVRCTCAGPPLTGSCSSWSVRAYRSNQPTSSSSRMRAVVDSRCCQRCSRTQIRLRCRHAAQANMPAGSRVRISTGARSLTEAPGTTAAGLDPLVACLCALLLMLPGHLGDRERLGRVVGCWGKRWLAVRFVKRGAAGCAPFDGGWVGCSLINVAAQQQLHSCAWREAGREGGCLFLHAERGICVLACAEEWCKVFLRACS